MLRERLEGEGCHSMATNYRFSTLLGDGALRAY